MPGRDQRREIDYSPVVARGADRIHAVNTGIIARCWELASSSGITLSIIIM
jgi:hypothetical protein